MTQCSIKLVAMAMIVSALKMHRCLFIINNLWIRRKLAPNSKKLSTRLYIDHELHIFPLQHHSDSYCVVDREVVPNEALLQCEWWHHPFSDPDWRLEVHVVGLGGIPVCSCYRVSLGHRFIRLRNRDRKRDHAHVISFPIPVT